MALPLMSANAEGMQSTLGVMSTPRASLTKSSFHSYCKTDLTTASHESYCYLSPQDECELSSKNGSANCSPPPTPRQNHQSNVMKSELSLDSLQLHLSSGRSLLHSKPEAIREANLRLSQRVTEMEPNVNTSGSGHIPELVLRAPIYPFQSIPLNTSGEDNMEEDMPVMVTPIKLKMRPSTNFQPEQSDEVSAAERDGDDCFFAPIRSGAEDDEFHLDAKMED